MSRRLLVCALVLLPLLAAAPATADVFGPLELASTGAMPGGVRQQAEGAIFPVVSADGRYVAFAGSFGGSTGIWRRDLETGTVEQVAGGDATMPSISANGRYISFTTTERLAAGDLNNSPDVYVRDMEPGPGEAEYELASAVGTSDEAPHYSFTFTLGENEEEELEQEREYGSIATARSAISASGRTVAFETTAPSNVLDEAEETPALEVFVRDLESGRTTLVSAEYNAALGRPANGEDVPVQPRHEGGADIGATFPGGPNTPRFSELDPTSEGAHPAQNVWAGASISADGSTVAWMGQDLEAQTQLLPGEQVGFAPQVAEPLWRRIADGPAAPIRRVTGGSDPNPTCLASGEAALPATPSLSDPCAGPFEHYLQENQGLWGTKVKADFVPQLSANGSTVAFITGARELAGGEVQFREAEATDDLYVVNMAGGLTRVQSLRRLTAIGGGTGGEEQIEKSAKVVDYTVSPDGGQVALTTQRTQFPLGNPALVSAPAASAGMIELFDVDLTNGTLTRVTHGFEGEGHRSEQLPIAEIPGVDPYQHEEGAYSPTFSADGNTLSFASTANNLVFGDGNGAPDAYVVHRIEPKFEAVPQVISAAPQNPVVTASWQLGARAFTRSGGHVLLEVAVPGAGTLAAHASGQVVVRKRRGHSSRLVTRQLASAQARVPASSEGATQLTLKLPASYRAFAAGNGLQAHVTLTFTAAGHPALHVTVSATFRWAKAKAKHASASRRRAR